MDIQTFNQKLRQKGRELYRPMPWREHIDPYRVLVSEMMLQQTQASRVIPKFEHFLEAFPTIDTLAQAKQSQVLKHWSGLGYNRRARYLHQTAKEITAKYDGRMPHSTAELTNFPGIGPNTAGAIVVYSYNEPAVFIETNVRAVIIHEFFKDEQRVSDSEIHGIVEKALDRSDPRQWYWAVMDYGASLKRRSNNISLSSHHKKQSEFEGSLRQLRGAILRELYAGNKTINQLQNKLEDARLEPALESLANDQLIKVDNRRVSLVD